MTVTPVFKCLASGGRSKHNFSLNGSPFWDLPKDGRPGAWKREADGVVLRPHFKGIHLSEAKDLVLWFAAENYVAEHGPRTAKTEDALVTDAARLHRRLDLTPRDWQTLALIWLEAVETLPSRLNYHFSYQRNVDYAHQVLNDRFNGDDGKPLSPFERHVDAQMRKMATDQLRDSGCTTKYAENCLAMAEMAIGYSAALGHALGARPGPTWEMAKAVARATRAAQVHEAGQPRASSPGAADLSRVRRAIADHQNSALLKRPGMPGFA